MNRHKVGPYLAVLFIATPVFSQSSDTLARRHAVGGCNPDTRTSKSRLVFDDYGVKNQSTASTAKLTCGGDYIVTQSTAKVGVMDINRTQDITCGLGFFDGEGRQAYSASRKSSGHGSALTWLTYTPPAGIRAAAFVSCTIPPADAGSGSPSYVAQIAW